MILPKKEHGIKMSLKVELKQTAKINFDCVRCY